MNFGKVLTAMATPFDSHGEIDYDMTTQLVNYLIDNGSDGLVVAGTTGESPTLTAEEKVSLLQHVVKAANKRVPVVAGTGSNHTKSSIELSQKAESVGVDALMLVTPYYNKPNQKGMYHHFKTIADTTSLPVMLYNVPGRSAAGLEPETVIELSKVDNIVSVKEASASLDGIAKIIEGTDDTFSLYSGDDNLTLPIYAVGGDGVVSVSSHIIGAEMQQMLAYFDEGKVKEASALHRKLLPFMKVMFSAPSPTPVKAALNMKGVNVGGVRMPLMPLDQAEEEAIKQLMPV